MDNYGEVKSEIADWINREDLSDKIPIFIRLAETEIFRDLRCYENEFTTTYNDQAAVDSFVILPANFAEMKLVVWNGFPLEHVSDQRLAERLARGRDRQARYFTITGRNIAFSDEIDPDPNNWEPENELVYSYYGTESLDSLPTWHVATNPVDNPVIEDNSPEGLAQTDLNTTRMLQRNPDLYLHGPLYFASLYLKDKAAVAEWGNLFKQALEDLRVASSLNQISGSTSQVTSVGVNNSYPGNTRY